MNKNIRVILSLVLSMTLLSTQFSTLVLAEEVVVESSEFETQSEISFVELKGLDEAVLEALNVSGLNTLIQKNLTVFQTKASLMINQEPDTLTQNEVDALSRDLEGALKDVQYSETLNAITELVELNLLPYDKSTTELFKSSKALASEMFNTIENEIVAGVPLETLQKVESLLASLNTGKAQLVLNNYDPLNEAITSAEHIKLDHYTSASTTKFKEALSMAKEALTTELSAQDLASRTKSLNDAIAGLESPLLPEQKALMDSFILKVKSFNDSKHSEESKTMIYDLDSRVKAFLAKDSKTMKEAERLLQEITQIETLMDNPEIKNPVLVDKTDLKIAINKASAIKRSDFTNDSWMAFQDTLTSARDIYKKETLFQEMINMATGNLLQAMESLVSTGKPITHPFNELKDYYYVGDVFTLSMGTQDTLKFDASMFQVEFKETITFTALQAGMSQIQFREENGSLVQFQIEIRELKAKHDDESLVGVGISPDHSTLIFSGMFMTSGLILILLDKKQRSF